MRKREIQVMFLVGALGLLPGAAYLSGCGGGGSSQNSTPTTQNMSLSLDFGNGQSGTLNLKVQATKLTGNLVVNERPLLQSTHGSDGEFHPFTSTIPAGSYPFSGTVADRSYSVSGTFPSPLNAFSIEGVLPTQTAIGVYHLDCGDKSAIGSFAALGTATQTRFQTGKKALLNANHFLLGS